MPDGDDDDLMRSGESRNARGDHEARDLAEEALRTPTEWLRVTLASIGDAVIMSDDRGRVSLLNGVAEALTGWPREEAEGRPLDEVFRLANERTNEPIEGPAARALREGARVGLADRALLVARDGSTRPVSVNASPMRGEGGATLGAVVVFRDMTEQKRSEEAQARLAAIVESSDDAIVSKTTDGVIRTWNAAAERLFGYSAEEAVGRPITLIIPPERLDEEREILRRIQAGERVAHFETRRVAKDGRSVDVSLTVSPLRDEDGRVIGASKIARDISERKRDERERRLLQDQVEAERSKLEEVFRRAPSFLAILRGPDHVFDLANDRYFQLVGHRDILGKPLLEALPEIRGQGFLEMIDRVYRTGEPEEVSNRHILLRREPGGPLEERVIEFVYQPLKGPDGAVTGIIAQGVDLTERRLAEDALRERDQRLRLFLENATDYAVIITDERGRVLEWKGGAGPITGWSEEDVLEMSADILFTPEDRAAGVPEAERRKAEREGRAEDKRWHRRRDGTRFFADGVMTALRGPDGELRGFGKVLRDATERKRSEETLARDALLLASVRDSVIVTDLKGIVTYWNEGATRLFGWSAEEMVGRPYSDRFPEPVRAVLEAQVRDRADGVDWSGEYEDYRKDGSRVWIDARVGLVRGPDGEAVGILGLAHDVTDRKRAEEALRVADRRKDEFIALLAHELRNPLAPIRNGLQIMKLAAADAPTVAEVRDVMDRQLGHMVRLIDDLLDISRIGQNKMVLRKAPVLLKDIVSHALEVARPAIEERGHQLSVSLPAAPVELEADLTRLAQVVSNLLTNSAKYTERGGRIWLAATVEGGEAVLSVKDTGIGIAASDLGRVFEMFAQVERITERSSGGLGIGLALVKGLVEMHGGSVAAESPGKGAGTTVTVRLPLPRPGPASPAQRGDATPGPARGRPPRRILIVDDNEDSARTLARILSILGDEVSVAHDGVQALEVAERVRPEIVLMDVGMPRMDGYEASRRLRLRDWAASVRIVALTGWGQDADRIRSREAGCDGHLVKPVQIADLHRLLVELEARRGPAPS